MKKILLLILIGLLSSCGTLVKDYEVYEYRPVPHVIYINPQLPYTYMPMVGLRPPRHRWEPRPLYRVR